LTDIAVTPTLTLTPGERFLARLGIRPEDKAATALMFSNMFMSGIAIGMIRVCAITLFLAYWRADQLALIAILIAVVGMPMTLLIDRMTQGISIRNYLFTLLGIILGGLAIIRLLLGVTDSPYLIFALPLFLELVYMLFSLQFVTLLSRLLNVRQTKRLTGIARSGEFLAELAGGMLIVLLLNFINVTDLLVVAMMTTLVVFGIVSYTVSHFATTLYVPAEESTDGSDSRMLGMLRLPYVRLITFCYVAYMFAYFFLDVAFYDYASSEFPDQKALASFIAQFFAITGFLTMLVMVFLFAPFLRRFGIIAGVIAFPVVIFIGATTVSTMELTGASVTLIFTVMVVTNASRIILQSAIWKSSVTVLFQVLPDRQRGHGIALTEGVIDPVAGGLAGICLFILTTQLNLEPEIYLLVLSVLMLTWILVGFMVRRLYLSNLVVSIQKRKLGEMSLTDLDNASLEIIKEGLKSPYPAEVFYCLNLLEEIEHPEITELIKQVLDNNNRDVRMDVLRRIAYLQIEPMTVRVQERIEKEPDPSVRGQALKTYAALKSEDTVERLTPFLEAVHQDSRKGALVGILSHDRDNELANQYLLQSVRSDDIAEQIFAAEVIGEIGSGHLSGYLVELLDNQDPQVMDKAIIAAGALHDSRLVNILVQKLSIPSLQGTTALALRQFGEAALYDLDIGLTSPEASRQEKFHMIDTIREIGGERAIEILLRHMDLDQPELRHQIYLSLASLHYQADPDDQYIFVNKLDAEVQLITWLLAAMEDLSREEGYETLHDALANELESRRDKMLLLISFLFPSIVMLDTRANIDSKVAELRVFALEILDNLLTGDIKQIVLPLLDDLTVAERLEIMSDRFPQERMSAEARLHNVIDQHYDRAYFWTRSCMLMQAGISRSDEHMEQIYQGLQDREGIIRETALWSLARINPAEARERIRGFMDDADNQVRGVAQALDEELPALDEAD
jgi:HEAT repeat protein